MEADDAARTVTLTSEAPVPFMLQNTGAELFIVCAEGLADRSTLAAGTDGTGPFVLEEAVANDHYTFSARDDYAWGPDGPTSELAGFPSEVVVRIVENESTAANLLLSGEVNIAGSRRGRSPARRERGLLRHREAGRSSVSSSSTRWRACPRPMSPCARR